MKILLTTTSFQDTPGEHQQLLNSSGLEIVRARGPLTEAQLLDILPRQGPFDGLLNGDDQLNAKVIDAFLPQLKVIAKYGIGLDSIDVQHATVCRVPVLFTPGVNETAVAEHAIGLMIAVARHFGFHIDSVKNGEWNRRTGRELWRKTLGIVGSGRIAHEVVKRCQAFDMKILACGNYWEPDFLRGYGATRAANLSELFAQSDVISLHTNLNEKNRGMINKGSIATMKDEDRWAMGGEPRSLCRSFTRPAMAASAAGLPI